MIDYILQQLKIQHWVFKENTEITYVCSIAKKLLKKSILKRIFAVFPF